MQNYVKFLEQECFARVKFCNASRIEISGVITVPIARWFLSGLYYLPGNFFRVLVFLYSFACRGETVVSCSCVTFETLGIIASWNLVNVKEDLIPLSMAWALL